MAPLRLFDFLPSPTTQAAPVPQLAGPPPQVLQMMPQGQVPVNAFMAPVPPPPPSCPSGMSLPSTGSQPFWQSEISVLAPSNMAPAPTYAPMAYSTDGMQGMQQGMQQVSWQQPPWNTPTATVQLPGATAHCLGPVNNPVIASGTAPGMSSNGMAGYAMAQAPMFMAAPMAPQQPPSLPPSKP